MRLLIHDTLATAAFALPLAAGWEVPPDGVVVEARPTLRGADLDPEDAALVPAAEAATAQATHLVAPEVGVVAGPIGSVALRTPVRADQVERTPVRLWGTSGAGELLARATLRPFYGIEPMAWVHDDAEGGAEAQAVVVEGAEALRPPEAGFQEDLCRAWIILTATPAVTHVLLVPRGADRAALEPVLSTLAALRAASHARRRELRAAIVAAHALDPDRVAAFFADQTLTLDADDRRGLLLLLQRGAWGSPYLVPTGVEFRAPSGGVSNPEVSSTPMSR